MSNGKGFDLRDSGRIFSFFDDTKDPAKIKEQLRRKVFEIKNGKTSVPINTDVRNKVFMSNFGRIAVVNQESREVAVQFANTGFRHKEKDIQIRRLVMRTLPNQPLKNFLQYLKSANSTSNFVADIEILQEVSIIIRGTSLSDDTRILNNVALTLARCYWTMISGNPALFDMQTAEISFYSEEGGNIILTNAKNRKKMVIEPRKFFSAEIEPSILICSVPEENKDIYYID